MLQARYTLITAAYNEEKLIGETISSIVAQTLQPAKWIIVSDGSTDATDEIVRRAAEQHDFIELVRVSEDHARNFAAQANAINIGWRHLKDVDHEFVGNIDADVTFAPDYFAALLSKFRENGRLGLAGGWIYEKHTAKGFEPVMTQTFESVAHAVQFFRRECFDALGGYRALPYGGPDTYAEVMARMLGWAVRSFPDLIVFHHRPVASAGGVFRGRFRQGRMDFSLGYLPLFEAVRCIRRLNEQPYLVGAAARFGGFCWAWISRQSQAVPNEFMQFFRKEQSERLLSAIGRRNVGKTTC